MELAGHLWGTVPGVNEEHPLQLRIGAHTGEVAVRSQRRVCELLLFPRAGGPLKLKGPREEARTYSVEVDFEGVFLIA